MLSETKPPATARSNGSENRAEWDEGRPGDGEVESRLASSVCEERDRGRAGGGCERRVFQRIEGHHAYLAFALPARRCRECLAVECCSALREEGTEAKGYEGRCFTQLEPRPTFDARDRTVSEHVSRE